MQKILLAIITIFIFSGSASAQCNASFTWSQSQPNVIDFVNTTSPQNPGSQYWWYYGDTLSDYGLGPFAHTYYVPGVYYVTLSVFDSLSQTSCLYYDTITVTGTVLCNMLVTAVGGVESYPGGFDGTALVTNITGGTAPYTYLWSNGGTTSLITGLTAGSYSVCVSDAAGCTTCDTVTVTANDSTSCGAGMIPYTFSGSPWINALGSPVGGYSSSWSLQWDFGDQTTGNGDDVWHQYALPGTYNLCVTLIDSLTGCIATSCDSVVVSFGQQNCIASFIVQPDTANPNQTWIFNVSVGSPSATYTWDWGDQTPQSTGPFPTHVYQNSGSYWILLVVSDPATQCVDTMYQMMWVPRLTQQASLVPHYVNVIPPGPTGINAFEAEETWWLYPNPVNSVLTITSSFTSRDRYLITDLSGRTVATGALGASTIDVSGFAAGTFVLTVVKENGEVASKRFVRE